MGSSRARLLRLLLLSFSSPLLLFSDSVWCRIAVVVAWRRRVLGHRF
jgi:hypothetical protein